MWVYIYICIYKYIHTYIHTYIGACGARADSDRWICLGLHTRLPPQEAPPRPPQIRHHQRQAHLNNALIAT